jgi:membrane complex biogenesis BtpA family protein
MTVEPAGVIGMVHLPALPGAPGYGGSHETVRERALRDAETLAAGGVDAVLVENFGDAPFYPDEVPRHVVASLTDVVGRVRRAVEVPVGVNVLRNDARAAVAVAAATGADFVRVNVHVGARVTDQGVVEGRAHGTLRLRERLDADVAVLADVGVKHSVPLGATGGSAHDGLVDEATEAVDRGLADGLVVSGSGTGQPTDRSALERVAPVAREADVPLLVGSGVTPETIADLLSVADGAVVGTALKRGGETTAPVDSERVAALVEAAGSA